MTLAAVVSAIIAILKIIPIIAKYFPPKTELQSQNEAEATVTAEVNKIESSGRP